MTDPLAKYANGDGTFNGVRFASDLSGLCQDEIKWTWNRLKYLIQTEKRSKADAKAIVKAEAVAKPWESAT